MGLGLADVFRNPGLTVGFIPCGGQQGPSLHDGVYPEYVLSDLQVFQYAVINIP